MKQMRSRFRLITLLLVCAFLLTLALCTGNMLRTAGVTLSSVSSLPLPGISSSPAPSSVPESPSDTEVFPAPAGTEPVGTVVPGTDNSVEPEYNIFGL